jgi:inner membrane protein
MGLKLLLVCLLALLMSIPALFVFGILHDRTNRANEVTREVGELSGGPQTFLGPVLTVPYRIPPKPAAAGQAAEAAVEDVLVIFPQTGSASAAVDSEVRQRSLFKVPVYTTDLSFAAHFDLADAAGYAPQGAMLDWSRAELVVGATDARGAKADVVMSIDGQRAVAAPAVNLTGGDRGIDVPPGIDPDRQQFTSQVFFGVPAPATRPGARFDAAASMKFAGAKRLAVLAFAKTTTFDAKSDWADPSFDGGFLPGSRTITDKGFTARWSVPFIARGVAAGGDSRTIARLAQTALGVTFVEPANPYQSVSRSLKYAPMFIGLVFLAYFLFESMARRRVHPAQYVLIGLAQIIFYLMLLSIAERVGFDLAFLISAGATVALISAYAGWVFESRRQGVIALVAFTALYALIYVLMRLEDFALLVGALTSFAAIAAVMYFTRGINWYGVAADGPDPSLEERA